VAQNEARRISHSIAQDEALGTAEAIATLKRELASRITAVEERQAALGVPEGMGARIGGCEGVVSQLGSRMTGCESECRRVADEVALLMSQVAECAESTSLLSQAMRGLIRAHMSIYGNNH